MTDSNPIELTQDEEGNLIPKVQGTPGDHPKRIGRYRIEEGLGSVGFGLVYLAHDDQTNLSVAINRANPYFSVLMKKIGLDE